MTKIETAKVIVEFGACTSGWLCNKCPLKGLPSCSAGNVKKRRDWLSANEPAPIIGWPGNVEEMRQYDGQEMELSDFFDFKPSTVGALSTVGGSKNCPYRCGVGCYFTYCRPIPLPAFPELTLSEIADKFGIPLDQLRIKDGKR
jgi:hypothetical protein